MELIGRLTSLALGGAGHAGGLELRDLLGHLLRLLGRHRLIDYAQEFLLVRIDQRQQLRVLLAQLLHQHDGHIQEHKEKRNVDRFCAAYSMSKCGEYFVNVPYVSHLAMVLANG